MKCTHHNWCHDRNDQITECRQATHLSLSALGRLLEGGTDWDGTGAPDDGAGPAAALLGPGCAAGGGVVRDVDGTGSTTELTCASAAGGAEVSAAASMTGDTGCTCCVGRTCVAGRSVE